ncbi:DUF4180 domain-containing protein [Massilia sp. YIM B04103]|uniref:DUF4180 domain-containing protein n=1 Tax=Massilia sp. YIM B04103 TaxID=2963106 RepID=UPI00210B8A28|nr:DUF4180 domain-containing protein [Massilia sp. YIM B04103]
MTAPADNILQLHGQNVLHCTAGGPVISRPGDLNDLMGHAFGHKVCWLVLDKARLSPDFFVLRTRFAGEAIQKLITHGLKLAIVDDLSAELDASEALRDFIRESNRGSSVWFLADLPAVEVRLQHLS